MSPANKELVDLPPSVADWQLLGSNELVGERKVEVDQFKNALQEGIRAGIRVLDIDELDHRVRSGNKAVSTQLYNAVVERAGNNFYVSPEYEWLAGAGYSAFHVRRAVGAETSAHGVFFGIMHDPDDSSKGISVAIKPCEQRPHTAIADWVNGSLVHKEDNRTYQPIGFILDGDGLGYSITKFKKEGFDTLDSTTWNNVLLHSHDPKYETQRNVIASVAEGLADMHSRNVYHGDPQFKNIVIDVTGEVYFIDWESADFYETPPKHAQMVHKMEHDLRVVFKSMALPENKTGVGLLHHFNDQTKWKLYKDYFFDPYMEQYLRHSKDAGTGEGTDFMTLAAIEERLSEYIEHGELFRSLSQRRANNRD